MSAHEPSPVDLVARGLDAAADGVRVPGDPRDPGIPVAATVVLLRDGADGPEALLLERPDRGSFAGAWVFPGGRIDDADRRDGDAETDAALRAAVRETEEETGLVLDEGALVPLSVWDPPAGAPVRIRTWFFVAADPGGAVVLSPDEAVASERMRPGEALARHGRGELILYPPTWVTLHGLRDAASTEACLDAARIAGVQRFETIARRTQAGTRLLWRGDAEHDGDAAVAASARHRLEAGTLPWVYTRTG